MKRLIKTLILGPMWPLIWYSEAAERHDDPCCSTPTSGCARRAKSLRAWRDR